MAVDGWHYLQEIAGLQVRLDLDFAPFSSFLSCIFVQNGQILAGWLQMLLFLFQRDQ